jgi:hypothetical protein
MLNSLAGWPEVEGQGEVVVEEGYREVVVAQMDFYACLIRRKYEE